MAKFDDEELKDFMDIASLGKMSLDLPQFSIFPNQQAFTPFHLKGLVFQLMKYKTYIYSIKPKLERAKKHTVYEGLFSSKHIQTAMEEYLGNFTDFDQNTYPDEDENPALEVAKMRTFAELAFFYRLHARDVGVTNGEFDSSFQPLVVKARADIEKIQETVASFNATLEAVDFDLLEMSDSKVAIETQIGELEKVADSRRRDLSIIRKTMNDIHPDRLLITRMAYNFFSHYGGAVAGYESIVLRFCKPILINATMKLPKVREYLELVPKMVKKKEP